MTVVQLTVGQDFKAVCMLVIPNSVHLLFCQCPCFVCNITCIDSTYQPIVMASYCFCLSRCELEVSPVNKFYNFPPTVRRPGLLISPPKLLTFINLKYTFIMRFVGLYFLVIKGTVRLAYSEQKLCSAFFIFSVLRNCLNCIM